MINSEKEVTCTCTKSSCQKNYCDCFKNGSFCGDNCRCLDCKNTKAIDLKVKPEKYSIEYVRIQVQKDIKVNEGKHIFNKIENAQHSNLRSFNIKSGETNQLLKSNSGNIIKNDDGSKNEVKNLKPSNNIQNPKSKDIFQTKKQAYNSSVKSSTSNLNNSEISAKSDQKELSNSILSKLNEERGSISSNKNSIGKKQEEKEKISISKTSTIESSTRNSQISENQNGIKSVIKKLDLNDLELENN